MCRELLAAVLLVCALALPAAGLAVDGPAVTTGDASFASQPDGSTLLTLTGTVTLGTELGGATFHFEYGTTSAYGQATSPQVVPAAAGPQTLIATLPMPDGAGVRYVYRLVVEQAGQVHAGGERAFHTRFPEPRFGECRVPALRGLTLPDARRRLRAAGCRVGEVQRLPRGRRSAQAPRTVRRQHPRAGRLRAEGAAVRLLLR